jgi:hypothetical protein
MWFSQIVLQPKSYSLQGLPAVDRYRTGTLRSVPPVIRNLESRHMAYRWYGFAVILSALPLGAGTIDVSAQVSALFGTGDELSFTVPSWNFGINAANFGLPVYPTEVEFAFVSVRPSR